VIQFPETAWTEWVVAAKAARADEDVRLKIERATLVERELERLRVRHEAALQFQQELDADQTPTLEIATLANYQNNPAAVPADIIDGVLKDNGLCIMLGPSGSGKSTLALQMVHSLKTGDDWLGQTTGQVNGGVGIVSYDMDSSMVLDWMSGFPNVDPDSISVVNAYKRGNPLGVPALRSEIVARWKAAKTEVVIVDSFSASFFGHDQNDAAATMQHYRDLKLFALTEVGARVLIVITHSTEGSPHKARGSTVHHDVADSIVAVETDKVGSRTVRVVKYRGARGQKQMDPVMVTAPDTVTNLVNLDFGAMSIAGMHIPPSAAAAAFTPVPVPHEQADTTADAEDESEDDL
jgi:archaellum biogenesis ATPase FlaH